MNKERRSLIQGAAHWSRTGWRQMTAFGLISIATTVLDFVLFNVLVLVDLAPVAANTISYSSGVVASYVLNKVLTFAGGGRAKRSHEFALFAAINLAGLLLNNIAVGLAESASGSVLALNLAKLAAGAATWVGKFIAFKRWVYPQALASDEGRD